MQPTNVNHRWMRQGHGEDMVADRKQFIRHLEIPFCSLYQQGFSSLGGMTNTRPNPALAIDSSAKKFRPAYELVRDEEERLGRDR